MEVEREENGNEDVVDEVAAAALAAGGAGTDVDAAVPQVADPEPLPSAPPGFVPPGGAESAAAAVLAESDGRQPERIPDPFGGAGAVNQGCPSLKFCCL